MSTSVQSDNRIQYPVPAEVYENEFELFLYLVDIIASNQCQCPCFKQTESTPDAHSDPPTTPAADGPTNERPRLQHPSGPVLQLPGNPCQSLVVWRSERRTSLITNNKQERERTEAFQRHFEPFNSSRWGGARGRGKCREQEEEHLEFDP